MSVEQTVQTMRQAQTHGADEKRHIKSRGERIFDWFTYGGIGAVGTFIATLPIAYWLTYTKHGAGYDSALRRLNSWGVKGNIKGGPAKTLLNTTILSNGGTAMLLPVAVLEHYKIPLVRGLNAMLNEPPDVAIQEAPKQTLGSLVKGRLVAFVTVWAGFTGAELMFPKTFSTFEKESAQLLCKTTGKVSKKTYRYGKIAALDIFATITSAVLLYIGSRFFAKRAKQRREHKEIHAHEGTPHHGVFAQQAERVEEKPAPVQDMPSSKINEIQHQAQLANAPQEIQISPS